MVSRSRSGLRRPFGSVGRARACSALMRALVRGKASQASALNQSCGLSGRDLPALEDFHFVVGVLRAGKDETQLPAAFRFQSGGEAVQIVERARAEERTYAVEDRVR
jgi:hypothetical protein